MHIYIASRGVKQQHHFEIFVNTYCLTQQFYSHIIHLRTVSTILVVLYTNAVTVVLPLIAQNWKQSNIHGRGLKTKYMPSNSGILIGNKCKMKCSIKYYTELSYRRIHKIPLKRSSRAVWTNLCWKNNQNWTKQINFKIWKLFYSDRDEIVLVLKGNQSITWGNLSNISLSKHQLWAESDGVGH